MKEKRDKIEGWQQSIPEVLLQTPVFDVVTSRVTCESSGIEKNFYGLDFHSWVNIIAVTPQEELVLIKQFRFGTSKIELEIPGGAVEKDEDPLAAGLRELQEETGYAGEDAIIIGKVCPNPALQDNLCYTVFVQNSRKISEQNLDEMEDIEVELVPMREVVEAIREGKIDHGLVLNGLMFYFLHTGNRM
jgi:8-oxo-dGTP pyrophosphatase MutT (NUDIX family)